MQMSWIIILNSSLKTENSFIKLTTQFKKEGKKN